MKFNWGKNIRKRIFRKSYKIKVLKEENKKLKRYIVEASTIVETLKASHKEETALLMKYRMGGD